MDCETQQGSHSMTVGTKTLPPIRLVKSICMELGTCWSALPPYYSGHYPTKTKAAAAATKRKRDLRANGELENRDK